MEDVPKSSAGFGYLKRGLQIATLAAGVAWFLSGASFEALMALGAFLLTLIHE